MTLSAQLLSQPTPNCVIAKNHYNYGSNKYTILVCSSFLKLFNLFKIQSK